MNRGKTNNFFLAQIVLSSISLRMLRRYAKRFIWGTPGRYPRFNLGKVRSMVLLKDLSLRTKRRLKILEMSLRWYSKKIPHYWKRSWKKSLKRSSLKRSSLKSSFVGKKPRGKDFPEDEQPPPKRRKLFPKQIFDPFGDVPQNILSKQQRIVMDKLIENRQVVIREHEDEISGIDFRIRLFNDNIKAGIDVVKNQQNKHYYYLEKLKLHDNIEEVKIDIWALETRLRLDEEQRKKKLPTKKKAPKRQKQQPVQWDPPPNMDAFGLSNEVNFPMDKRPPMKDAFRVKKHKRSFVVDDEMGSFNLLEEPKDVPIIMKFADEFPVKSNVAVDEIDVAGIKMREFERSISESMVEEVISKIKPIIQPKLVVKRPNYDKIFDGVMEFLDNFDVDNIYREVLKVSFELHYTKNKNQIEDIFENWLFIRNAFGSNPYVGELRGAIKNIFVENLGSDIAETKMYNFINGFDNPSTQEYIKDLIEDFGKVFGMKKGKSVRKNVIAVLKKLVENTIYREILKMSFDNHSLNFGEEVALERGLFIKNAFATDPKLPSQQNDIKELFEDDVDDDDDFIARDDPILRSIQGLKTRDEIVNALNMGVKEQIYLDMLIYSLDSHIKAFGFNRTVEGGLFIDNIMGVKPYIKELQKKIQIGMDEWNVEGRAKDIKAETTCEIIRGLKTVDEVIKKLLSTIENYEYLESLFVSLYCMSSLFGVNSALGNGRFVKNLQNCIKKNVEERTKFRRFMEPYEPLLPRNRNIYYRYIQNV